MAQHDEWDDKESYNEEEDRVSGQKPEENDQEAQIPRKTREHSRSRSGSSSGSSRSSNRSGSSSGSSRSSASSGKISAPAPSSSGSRSKRRSSTSSSSMKGRALNIVLFITRISVSISMLTHGMQKFDMLISNRANQFIYDPIGLGPNQSLILAIFAEVLCSALLIFGLFARFATIPLMITMLVAILGVHLEEGFNKWELPAMYFLLYLTLLVTGPGKYSLDRYIKKLRKQSLQ